MGRYIILKADVKDTMYVLINTYAPKKDKDVIELFKNLLMTLKSKILTPEENIIAGGDSNCLSIQPVTKKKAHLINEHQSCHALRIVCKMNLI